MLRNWRQQHLKKYQKKLQAQAFVTGISSISGVLIEMLRNLKQRNHKKCQKELRAHVFVTGIPSISGH